MRGCIGCRWAEDYSLDMTKPMERFCTGSGGVISCRMASNTCFNWARVLPASWLCSRASSSVLLSSSARRSASSLCVARASRNWTKARTTYRDISTARGEFRTVAAMSAPCSVNANGNLRRPPRPVFDVAICDIKVAYSGSSSRNMKSAGKRSALRRTCSFRRRVSTPYSWARSLSIKTFWPRGNTMRAPIASAATDRSGKVLLAGMIDKRQDTQCFKHITEAWQ